MATMQGIVFTSGLDNQTFDCDMVKCVFKGPITTSVFKGSLDNCVFEGDLSLTHFSCKMTNCIIISATHNCIFAGTITKTNFVKGKDTTCSYTGQFSDCFFENTSPPPDLVPIPVTIRSSSSISTREWSKQHYDKLATRCGINETILIKSHIIDEMKRLLDNEARAQTKRNNKPPKSSSSESFRKKLSNQRKRWFDVKEHGLSGRILITDALINDEIIEFLASKPAINRFGSATFSPIAHGPVLLQSQKRQRIVFSDTEEQTNK